MSTDVAYAKALELAESVYNQWQMYGLDQRTWGEVIFATLFEGQVETSKFNVQEAVDSLTDKHLELIMSRFGFITLCKNKTQLKIRIKQFLSNNRGCYDEDPKIMIWKLAGCKDIYTQIRNGPDSDSLEFTSKLLKLIQKKVAIKSFTKAVTEEEDEEEDEAEAKPKSSSDDSDDSDEDEAESKPKSSKDSDDSSEGSKNEEEDEDSEPTKTLKKLKASMKEAKEMIKELESLK
jgi:hypothetical protein